MQEREPQNRSSCFRRPSIRGIVLRRSLESIGCCESPFSSCQIVPKYLFLSFVYAVESLCRLNQPKDAAEQLSVYVADGNNFELPYANEDRQNWSDGKGAGCGELNGSATAKTTAEGTETTMVESQVMGFMKPEEARGFLYVNLAAMSAMQGDLEQATHFIKQGLSSLPNNPRVLLAAVYMDLLQGKTEEALVKLRNCRKVRFLCTNVTISS